MAEQAKYSIYTAPGDGITTVWDFNFAGAAGTPGYISRDHVVAYRTNRDTGNVLSIPIQWVGPNTVRLEPPVPTSDDLTIKRITPKVAPLVDYTSGSILNERNLDTSNRQAIYAVAELIDAAAEAGDGGLTESVAFQALAQSAAAQVSAAEAKALALGAEQGLNNFKITLAGPDGSSYLGFKQPGVTAYLRTSQGKMRDHCNVKDYRWPEDPDATLSFQRAIDAGHACIEFGGDNLIGGHITVNRPVVFLGNGRSAQLTFTNDDAWIKLDGRRNAIIQGVTFENCVLNGVGTQAPHIFADWARQITFHKVFQYHCDFSLNHMNFWDIAFCLSYDSNIYVRYTQNAGEDNQVSGAPRVTASFFSNTLIDLYDCVDLQITNSHFFQAGCRSRLENWHNSGTVPDEVPKSTFLISNTFFDSIFGTALDLWDVGLTSITGCFFSAGRNLGVDGVYLYRNWHVRITGCTFHYCGAYGLTLENCRQVQMGFNGFTGSKEGGVRTIMCDQILAGFNSFGNKPSVYGGSYTQPVGWVDVGGNSTNVRVQMNTFSDLAVPLDLIVTAANGNCVQGNSGVLDILDGRYTGTTANRPTGSVPLGHQYYDQTLGKPVWRYGNGTWRDAAGATV